LPCCLSKFVPDRASENDAPEPISNPRAVVCLRVTAGAAPQPFLEQESAALAACLHRIAQWFSVCGRQERMVAGPGGGPTMKIDRLIAYAILLSGVEL